MTGVVALVSYSIVLFSLDCLGNEKLYLDKIIKLPTTFIIVVAPILLTLFGLLFEPIANYFERYLGNILFFWLKNGQNKVYADADVMKDHIKSNAIGDLCGKIKNPFPLCKEYVETKQLSTTFMVFLARYGFYRNCCLIIFVSGAYYFAASNGFSAWIVLISTYFFSAILKKRADEFYSYQAPAVYSAFLIDNLNWPSKTQNVNTPDEQ